MKRRSGFTLVELVVVILILGILAAVAAPKLFNTSADATDNGLKQTLAVVRDAIDLYAADNGGTLPGQGTDDLDADLADYLRGGVFPKNTVGPAKNALIKYTGTGPILGETTPTLGWHYARDTGQFIINWDADTASDNTIKYEEL